MPQTSAALSKSHCCALLQGGITRWGSWAQTYLESQNLDLALTRSFFSHIYIVVVPCSLLSWFLRAPELPVCCMGSWTSCRACSGFLPSALWQRIAALKIESLSLIELCRVLQEAWNQTSAPRAFVQGFDHKPIFSVRTIFKFHAGFCPHQEKHCTTGSIYSGRTWDRQDAANWWNCTV